MTTSPTPGERLRAPVEDGGIVSVPSVHRARLVAESNAAALNSTGITIAERSLGEMRVWTRAECVTRSLQWMRQTLGLSPRLPEGLLYVTGHQPSLNHPGVWMKNVAVAHLARCSGTTGLNLIVDNDIAGPPVIRVPAGTRETPRFEPIEYDAPSPTQPWEERQLQSKEVFDTFADRVAEALQPWKITPSLTECWPDAIAAQFRTRQMSSLLTACRVSDERRWNISNLELPVSEMCQTEPFLAFAQHLIQNHECFFTAYNAAVHWYRRHYHIRNHRHPMPDLEQQNNRLELPFWYWEPGETDRHRVFASRGKDEINLYAGEEHIASLPAQGCDVTRLQELQKRGRFRTRALTTTLFARLCLSDLFVHGIGGAKYDEITDRMIQNFFGFTPPGFLTLTATIRLPLDPFPVTSQDLATLRTTIRKLQIDGPCGETTPELTALQQSQIQLIAEARRQREEELSRRERRALRGANRQRYLQLKQNQQELERLAGEQIEETESLLARKTAQHQANGILKSREFPTCLFPHEVLQPVVNRLRSEVCSGRSVESGMHV